MADIKLRKKGQTGVDAFDYVDRSVPYVRAWRHKLKAADRGPWTAMADLVFGMYRGVADRVIPEEGWLRGRLLDIGISKTRWEHLQPKRRTRSLRVYHGLQIIESALVAYIDLEDGAGA